MTFCLYQTDKPTLCTPHVCAADGCAGETFVRQVVPYLGCIAGVGPPGQLGKAEAQHGDHIDIHTAILEAGHRLVYSLWMLSSHIRRHLQPSKRYQ